MPQIWQIAVGAVERYYDDLFLADDVMFLGPGRFGPFEPALYSQLSKNGSIAHQVGGGPTVMVAVPVVVISATEVAVMVYVPAVVGAV